MAFSKDENENIVSLLLHTDQVNVELALSILEHNEEAVNDTVIYALNILSLLSSYNIPYEQRPKKFTKKNQELKAKIQIHERITTLLQQKAQSVANLNPKNLQQDIFLFALRNMPDDEQERWQKWWKKYIAKRKEYEPLLLQNSLWHDIYQETIGFLYAQRAYKECIDLCDTFLSKIKKDDDTAYIRYLAVGHLIAIGEYKERLPQQLDFSLNGLKTMPKYTHCMYNFFLANDYYLFGDYVKCRDFYLEAWNLRQEDLRYSRGVYAALAAHRLSYLYFAQIELDDAQAYYYAKAAYELKTNMPNITTNWAYWLWKYKKQNDLAKNLLQGLINEHTDFILPKFYLLQIEWEEQNANFIKLKKPLLSLLSNTILQLKGIKNQLLPFLYLVLETLNEQKVYPDIATRVLEIISDLSD